MNAATQVEITGYDIFGKVLLTEPATEYAEGEQVITFNKNKELAKDIYFVNVMQNRKQNVAKLIIK